MSFKLNALAPDRQVQHVQRRTEICVNDLAVSAIAGLERMFDPNSQLFCFRVRLTESGTVREGISERYTMITLLGLHQAEAAGMRSFLNPSSVLDCLLQRRTWTKNLGDVGLMLWLCALVSPQRILDVCSIIRLESALDRFKHARERHTMELAWLLSGLSHAALAQEKHLADYRKVAVKCLEMLQPNQGRHGFFGHQATRGNLMGTLRGHIGSFADQVYPIYALARAAQAFASDSALDMARSCAKAICDAQGPYGQWWWHYDAFSCQVVQRYPAYSVHQDGMAPMALFALGETAEIDLTAPISKGLAWISGNNEIGADLRDTRSNLIWRSIYYRGWTGYYNEFINRFRSCDAAGKGNLRILYECRPYHLGWLLYAYAGRC